MTKADEGAEYEPAPMSFADFGQRFIELAVTRERVAEAVSGVAGRPIKVGPLSVGPMRLAKVRTEGQVGEPEVESRHGKQVEYLVIIPATLELTVELARDRYRFTASVRIRLTVTARAGEPLFIVIDVETPSKQSIDVDLHAEGMRASVLKLVGGIDGEIRKAVAAFVAREIEESDLQKARLIDVGKALLELTTSTSDE